MQLSERMMIERYELGSAREDAALRPRGGAALTALTLTLTATAVLLIVGVVQKFEGWAHLVVLGGLLTTVIGLMIALSPNRRGA
jgi:hypothetical protein